MEMTRDLQIIIRERHGLNKIAGPKGFEKAKLHVHFSASLLSCALARYWSLSAVTGWLGVAFKVLTVLVLPYLLADTRHRSLNF